MSQEENAPPFKPEDERKTEDNSNGQQAPLGNRTTILSPRSANIILYFIVFGLLGLVAGIVLYAYGKLPSQLAQIAAGLGALVAIISAIFGSTIEKSVRKGFIGIWKNANRVVMISSATLTVLILASSVILVPLFLPNIPNIPNPYPPQSGTLVFSDPLRDNSRGYMWDEFATGFGTCGFHGGAYHVTSIQAANYHRCGAQNISSLGNFAYEVEMTILAGDCGALIFRGDFANYRYYYFHICKDGSYDFYIYTHNGMPSKMFPQGSNPNINPGLGMLNLIAVVAINDLITVYVNHQVIYNVYDSTFSQGQIGLSAENLNEPPTEVAFSNARVWML